MMKLVAMIARGARSARDARGAWVLLLAVAALAAGCGTTTTPPAGGSGNGTTAPARGSATPVPTTTGGRVVPGEPACAGWPAGATRGPLPASFVPAAALRCVSGYQLIPGKGQWQTATLERADTNLAPLIAALRRPPEHRNSRMMCPEIAMMPPQLALIGQDGKAIMPTFPLSGCGQVQPQVLGAISALSWHKVSVRLVAQVQTQQEVASGCTPQYRDPFAMYGSLSPSAGGTVLPARPASLRICVYDSGSGGAASTPQFVRAATVNGAAERGLLSGLSGAGRATPCTLPDQMFAVIGGTGAPLIYVELGGCHRVLRYESKAGGLTAGMTMGQATPGAVAAIESLTRP